MKSEELRVGFKEWRGFEKAEKVDRQSWWEHKPSGESSRSVLNGGEGEELLIIGCGLFSTWICRVGYYLQEAVQ